MAGEFLLDTSAAIQLINDRFASIGASRRDEKVIIPAIVVGELLHGVAASKHRRENEARLASFLRGVSILPCDEGSARLHARIRNSLKQRGRPIPDNDIWIAAVALQHDLTLVTNDAHFQHVETLRVESWA